MSGVPPAARAQAFVAGVLARGLVARCADLFAGHGIRVMALKGAALHALVYDDPSARPLSDVDLLVAPRDHARAVAALTGAGFARAAGDTPWAATLAAPDAPLPVDLHRALFPPGLFRLDAADLFARASRADAHFGAPVLVPGPYDLYAHAVGHFAKTRMDERNPRAFADLARIPVACALDARRCAAHLESAGLARATRYVFAAAPALDPFARDVVRALPPDPLGDLLAGAAIRLARACAQPRALSAPAAHLVNASLAGGLRSFAAHAVEPLRRRLP